MAGIININNTNKTDNFGRRITSMKNLNDFSYLIGANINDIILFDNSTDDLLNDSSKIILPRYYSIFIGNNNNESQYKPYEYDQYRIVVSVYKNIIISVDSIG